MATLRSLVLISVRFFALDTTTNTAEWSRLTLAIVLLWRRTRTLRIVVIPRILLLLVVVVAISITQSLLALSALIGPTSMHG